VHCLDIDPHSGSKGGAYEDTALVPKYKMTDEEYDKRKGTLRDWTREQKSKDENFNLAKHAREHRELMEAVRQFKLGLPLPDGFEVDDATGKVRRIEPEDVGDAVGELDPKSKDDAPGIESVQGMEVGMRCEVQPGGRRGYIAYIGEICTLGTGGYWIGVKFDEPVGKADGCAKGLRYFDAQPGYGGFIRGKNLLVGDFPERDIFDEDSEDEL